MPSKAFLPMTLQSCNAAGAEEGGLTVPIAQSTILHDGVAETSPQQHSPLQAGPQQHSSVKFCISQAGFL